jgi:carboxymuconolactone decarboxylase
MTTIQTIAASSGNGLSVRQQHIAEIASCTGRGDLETLKPALSAGLDDGLTVNEIREVIIHAYAYCGFPRSLRALQTFISVLDERKAQGIEDIAGKDASPVEDDRSRYERGRDILAEISGVPADAPKAAYAEFAPVIEQFLKEHLFADLFERDVLTYAERELATVSVIAALGESVEPMLRSHMGICRNLGMTEEQLDRVLSIAASDPVKDVFPKGNKLPDTPNFTGEAWLAGFVSATDSMDCTVGNVTFAPGVRNSWHSHPGGQILLCTSGEGRYQEKGKPVQVLHPGDVVKIAPNVIHWHGAAPDSEFTHIAIGTQQSKGGAVWLDPVTDKEYNQY